MKVRVKKTGDVLNVADYAKVATEGHDSLGNPLEYYLDEIEIIPDEPQAAETPAVDWGQRRYEIARDAICAYLSSYGGNLYSSTPDAHIKCAIGYADELIKQLKGQ